MAAGKFSCDGCGKGYTWKPELAGRRVKCKCGNAMTVPATDPSTPVDGLPEGFDDFAALGDGAPAQDDGAYAAVAAPPARAKGGATCPTCGRAIDAGAVICVGCGTNLKTGKKLKTQKEGGGGAVAGGKSAADVMPGYRSYGAVATDEPMSPQKKKMIMLSSIGGLVAIIAVIAIVLVPKAMENRRRTAELDAANPGELGAALSAMEKAGGMTEAIKDGSLAEAVSKTRPPVVSAKPPYWAIQERHERIRAEPGSKVGKKWIQKTENHFMGRTREESVKIMDTLYGFGVTSAQVLWVAPSDTGNGGEMATAILVVLPTDPDARKQIFAWYRTLDKTLEPHDLPRQTDMGQKYLSIEFVLE